MAAILQKTENMHYYFDYIKSIDPCGNCNSEVLEEEWNFRIEIVDQDPITDVIYDEIVDIPFYCDCINGFFSEKELRKFVTKNILSFFCTFDESALNHLLDKYYKYIDDEQINKRIISLDENEYYFHSNKLKIFLEVYESLVHVNLKPAKR
jgi:hypothetical protein